MNKYYVYMYIDPETRKPFYIGKGTASRAWAFTGHDHNKWLTIKINTIRNKGYKSKDFVIIMDNNLLESEAFEQEKLLIEQYGKKMDGGILFNINDGGVQPPSQKGKTWKLSEQSIINMKASWTPERREKNSIKFKTIERTADWCAKISAGKRKAVFDQIVFEQYVLSNYKLKDIIDMMNITYDIFRDRALLTYNTVKFRDIKKLINIL